jgi:hypothetical protein
MNYEVVTRALLLLSVSLALTLGCGGGTTPAQDTGNGGLDAAAGEDAASADDAATVADAGTDAGSTDDAAQPTDTGASTGSDGGCLATLGALNNLCTDDTDCPAGFVCQTSNGIVASHSCQIRCDDPTFSCPCGTACSDHSDKGASWRQCDQL